MRPDIYEIALQQLRLKHLEIHKVIVLDFENSRIEQYKRQIGVNYQLKEPDKISLLKAIRLPRHFLHYPELIKF